MVHMTVAELIEKLQALPDWGLSVYVFDEGAGWEPLKTVRVKLGTVELDWSEI